MAETLFKQRGINRRTIEIVATTAQVPGDVLDPVVTGGPIVVVVGGMKGENAIANTESMIVVTQADRLILPTYNGAAGVFAVGAPVYWDDADSKCSNLPDTGINKLIGYCTATAASADEEVELDFDGFYSILFA